MMARTTSWTYSSTSSATADFPLAAASGCLMPTLINAADGESNNRQQGFVITTLIGVIEGNRRNASSYTARHCLFCLDFKVALSAR